uniref:glycine--tRNA ligase subunit beta n=1 Tax=Ningiella ruwaisensis TaxID=2364274 RepID=UPI00109F74B0|nr:glycine--tRNA ligase subunit beta [Ningiella ruwaisensis]
MDTPLNTLLIELGTEELPPKALKQLTEAFSTGIADTLSKLGFEFASYKAFGAPRRLAISLEKCQRIQADKVVEKRGPALSAAFDEKGQATKAALGWAKGNGINVEDAERLKTDKGEWLLYKQLVPGQRLDDLIEDAIKSVLKQLPIPKAMRWGTSEDEFIRPVHTLCIMYADEVIDASVLGIQAGNQLSGHRFHGDHRFTLEHADNYEQALEAQYVIADYQKRSAVIKQQLDEQGASLGLKPDYDALLLEEISSLVEWPVVLQASFETRFLKVPKEALIYTMKDDQKYVPLLHTKGDNEGQLANTFLFVSNIESKDPSQVIAGNEKVIRPRLSDAEFFFESDKKTRLDSKAEKLGNILFQKSLGTIADKSARVAQITQLIGKYLGLTQAQLQLAKRAAFLAKADLVSNMVSEFPSVQGVMGRHYALHDGEDEAVALAIEEQYLPRFSGDNLPDSQLGILLSLADKLDTLVGIFGVNMIPKGDKDPFALRRSAIGILRMLVSFELDIKLNELIDGVVQVFGNLLKNQKTSEQIQDFLLDRLKPFYHERGISADIVNAVLATHLDSKDISISDIHKRILAVSSFTQLPSAAALVEANKRVANILNKNDVSLHGNFVIKEGHLALAEEKALNQAYLLTLNAIDAQENKDYSELLITLSALKEPLDAFFDKVMIMVDDKEIKENRIALIASVRQLFLSVADISLLNIRQS